MFIGLVAIAISILTCSLILYLEAITLDLRTQRAIAIASAAIDDIIKSNVVFVNIDTKISLIVTTKPTSAIPII